MQLNPRLGICHWGDPEEHVSPYVLMSSEILVCKCYLIFTCIFKSGSLILFFSQNILMKYTPSHSLLMDVNLCVLFDSWNVEVILETVCGHFLSSVWLHVYIPGFSIFIQKKSLPNFRSSHLVAARTFYVKSSQWTQIQNDQNVLTNYSLSVHNGDFHLSMF